MFPVGHTSHIRIELREIKVLENLALIALLWHDLFVREGCGKSKWKFKMAFAMKGGGSRGGLVCH